MRNIRVRSVLDQFSACIQETATFFSEKFRDDLSYATSQKAKKQGEMPFHSLSPIPFISVLGLHMVQNSALRQLCIMLN